MHKRTLLLLSATLLLAPFVNAHGAPNPIEAEDLILDDEATDMILWDGWDIQSVHVREAHMGMQDGIVVRWTLWGGDSVGNTAESRVSLTFDNPADVTLEWTTMDGGATWEPAPLESEFMMDADMPMRACNNGFIVENEFEQDEAPGLGVPTWNAQFQAFVPLCALGVSLGDSLDAITAHSYADDAHIDVAPGPFYSPASGMVPLVDPLDQDSTRLIESLLLDGADRYTASTLTFVDGTLTVEVDNLISVQGQHVFLSTSLVPVEDLHMHDENGEHPVGNGMEAEAGEDLTFEVELGNTVGTFEVYVETDLGGREVWYVDSDGDVSTEPIMLDDEGGEVGSPGAGAVLSAVALLGAVAAVRRR